MDLKTMYSAAVNSKATVTMGVLDISTTTVEVLDGTVLPDAPNLLVLGTDNTAETVRMTAKDGNTLTLERAFQGIAKSWPAGTQIARNLTAYDIDTLRENMETVNDQATENAALANGVKQYKALSELSANESTSLLVIFAAMAVPSRLVCDITAGSTNVYPAAVGVLMITKTSADTGTATFVYDDGRIATASFTGFSSSGGVNQSEWNRLTDRVTSMCNPNLLINPDFKINQRGQTEYRVTRRAYTFDMWCVESWSGEAKITINRDSSVTIAAPSEGDVFFYQTIEKEINRELVAQTLEVKSLSGICDFFMRMAQPPYAASDYNYISIKSEGIISNICRIYNSDNPNYDGLWQCIMLIKAGSTITLNAVKLELGEFSTLANEIVDHAAELRKCQRYFYRTNAISRNWITYEAIARESSKIAFRLPIPPMRSLPTVTLSNTLAKMLPCPGVPSVSISINSIFEVDYAQGDAEIVFQANTSDTGKVAGDRFLILLGEKGEGSIDFSAEL